MGGRPHQGVVGSVDSQGISSREPQRLLGDRFLNQKGYSLYQALQPGIPTVPCVPLPYASHSGNRGGMKDALPGGHLGDNLIGLMRSDVHLDVGGGLEEFPYTG